VSSYAPVLYTTPLNPECVRVKRAIRRLGVDVETKDVLVSRRNRDELQQLLDGDVVVPCLALPDSVITEGDEILRYLRLRYGTERSAG
jgi:glutathione S-transferase